MEGSIDLADLLTICTIVHLGTEEIGSLSELLVGGGGGGGGKGGRRGRRGRRKGGRQWRKGVEGRREK